MKIIDSYKLIGPNRRSERTVVEVWIELTENELEQLGTRSAELLDSVLARLSELGIASNSEPGALTGSGTQQYAAVFCHVALAIQQHAGHRVSFQATYPCPQPGRAIFAVEFEQGEAGLEAVRIANILLEEVFPAIGLDEDEHQDPKPFEDELRAYLQAAPEQLLPQQTQDIIDAAERLDIPWVKLDRDPYEGLTGDFRVRPNGMLKLGHACLHRVIDGSFPIDAPPALAQLVHDRMAARQALHVLGAPLPSSQPGAGQSGEEDLSGRTFQALLGNGELLGVFALDAGVAIEDVTAATHDSTRLWLTGLIRKLGVPLLTVRFVSEDMTLPLGQAGHVAGMNVAPGLDDFLPVDGNFPCEAIRRRAAESLLRNLFPEGQPSRVPLISVTGTNGKSTVCTMISRVMQQQGYAVGRSGTTGIYHNDDQLESGDFGGGKGHHRVLESPDVNLAVLETARGAVSGLGLSYDHSDVSVCTNVSPDHLGERGIETVAQMAELKQFIVNRARKAIVLNADDQYCTGMLPHLEDRQLWLVSEKLTSGELQEQFGKKIKFCTAEITDDAEWISLHDETASVPVIPVNEIPATFNGVARFNVSNAMQAVAAGFAMGASIANIRKALSGYVTDYKTSPGRLNFYDELPFRVLFDFAHNDESHRAILQIIDQEKPAGRKILCFSRRGNSLDEHTIDMAAVVAGGYDDYICFENPYMFWRQPMEVPPILRQGLIQHGVDPSRIQLAGTDEAMQKALDMCREGDLLVFCTTTPHIERDWAELTSYTPENRI